MKMPTRPDQKIERVGAKIFVRGIHQEAGIGGNLRHVDFRWTGEEALILVDEQVERGIGGVIVEDAGRHAQLVEPEQRYGRGAEKLAQRAADGGCDRRDPDAGPAQQVEFVPFSLASIRHDREPTTVRPVALSKNAFEFRNRPKTFARRADPAACASPGRGTSKDRQLKLNRMIMDVAPASHMPKAQEYFDPVKQHRSGMPVSPC
ncbi:MAG: hypothetical protein WDM81_06490 [Rhizomicrobium sp.]